MDKFKFTRPASESSSQSVQIRVMLTVRQLVTCTPRA